MTSRDPRPRVLIALDWYLPAYRAGGPIRSIANLVANLHHDVEFFIVCGNRDLGDEHPLDVPTGQWVEGDGARVLYWSPAQQTRANWEALLKELAPDTLYLNSLFSGPFSRLPWSVARNMDIRTLLAPRGMLGTGALSIKPWRKRAWLAWQKWSGRYAGLVWHASTQEEAEEIQQWFPGAAIRVALNLPLPFAPLPPKGEASTCHVLSVGRIHPIKNYPFACDVVHALHQAGHSVHYRIVGPTEDAAEAQKIASSSGVAVELTGPVPPVDMKEHYAWADLVLVPSFNENFGHAVAEAVSAARPAIVSDQTAWSRLEHGPSVECLPLEVDTWVAAARRLLSMSPEALKAASKDTHERCLANERHLEAHRQLFA